MDQNRSNITIILGLITIIVTIGIHTCDSQKPPRFAFVRDNGGYFLPNDTIIFEAINRSSKEYLDIEYDGLSFYNCGIPLQNTNPQRWAFYLNEIPVDLRNDGKHQLNISFHNHELKWPISIKISSKPPVVEAQYYSDSLNPDRKDFLVKAATKNQDRQDTIKLDLFFMIGDSLKKMNVPVSRVIDESTGLFYFEFKTSVQGFPKIDSKDARYSKDFFRIEVSDQAGNTYYSNQSYAEFMAPGNKSFGANKLADIKILKPPFSDGERNLTVRYIPTNPPIIINKLSSGEPPIVLTVTKTQTGENKLKWKSKIYNITGTTEIYRDQKFIGGAFVDSFTDHSQLIDDTASYRVQQKNDNKVYRSNEVKVKNWKEINLGYNNPAYLLNIGSGDPLMDDSVELTSKEIIDKFNGQSGMGFANQDFNFNCPYTINKTSNNYNLRAEVQSKYGKKCKIKSLIIKFAKYFSDDHSTNSNKETFTLDMNDVNIRNDIANYNTIDFDLSSGDYLIVFYILIEQEKTNKPLIIKKACNIKL